MIDNKTTLGLSTIYKKESTVCGIYDALYNSGSLGYLPSIIEVFSYNY